MSSSSDSESSQGEQIRVSLTLAEDCTDRAFEVPSEPIAIPADTGRKGLAAVINHLLGREVIPEKDEEQDEMVDDDDDEDDDLLPAIPFDFIVGKGSKRLLRTSIEREARRSGLTLEEAIPITYFPTQKAPELSGESEEVPDWIAAMSFTPENNILCTGCYDGSIVVFQANDSSKSDNDTGTNVVLQKMTTNAPCHSGPIKCMATSPDKDDLWIATGSMDHTLSLGKLDVDTYKVKHYAKCIGGNHTSAIGSVDLIQGENQKLLASGDWDGTLCIWDYSQEPQQHDDEEQPVKRSKTGIDTSKASLNSQSNIPFLTPKVSIQAHTSKISGVSWGNYEKNNSNSSIHRQLITGSWDHSLKVWDVEREDCLMTMNGSRVVSCLDTSYHSIGVVATGHPDCTVRLWDMRTSEDLKESSIMTNNALRPSHKEWISAVQWSRENPYHLASTSHDGTVKVWDIRSPIPLHTVRAFPKEQKGLSLAYGTSSGQTSLVFVGGTDCAVKQLRSSLNS